jgi:hypothetical protein
MYLATIRVRPGTATSDASVPELGAAVMHLADGAAGRDILKERRLLTTIDLHPALKDGNSGGRRKGSGPDSMLCPENVGD